ncbi:MAG TPA: alkaline phosphatase family protein, partial [Ferruginibacter sp.]|nr:alkaline phosphatase family protein [Ferruginibacter sp.]
DSLMQIDWTPVMADNMYDQSAPENNSFEKPLNHEKQTQFPHVYREQVGKNYDAFQESPYGNWITLDFAKQLIRSEQIGQNGQTDLLCVSLSSIDKVAHLSGPQSKEMEDMFIRLDRDLADFFQFLDRQYGAGNYLLFLSADHGAPQAPAFLQEHQLPAGNVSSGKIKEELNAFCEANFQVKNAVRTVMVYDVYLNHAHLDTLSIDQEVLKKAMVAFLEKRPGIFAAYDFSNLSDTRFPTILRDRILNGYYARRSGDIQYIVENHYLYSAKPTGTEHGAWYNYDAHIPMIWYGWHIPKGRSYRTVYMTDIAVTLSALLHIQMPSGAVGNVLPEIIR